MTPSSRSPRDGSSRHGSSRYGSPRDGSSRHGSSRYGSARDGSADDEVYTFDTRTTPENSTSAQQPERPRRSMTAREQVAPRRVTPAPPTAGRPARPAATRTAPPPPAAPAASAPRHSRPVSGTSSTASVSRPGPTVPRRRRRGRRVLLTIVLLVLAWVAFMVWVPVNAWNNIERVQLTGEGARPAAADGATYLLVGSDSREGLSAADKKRFGATDAEGKRTDTIILVHVPSSGVPIMVSLPRDSYVPIPGHGKNKINAAYALGGGGLLIATVEEATGLPIDGYLEIGFGGFANIVDAVGGVDICVKFDMKDPEAGINLKKGCQTLNGADALGYVRSRKTDPRGDLGRAERQRELLAAVMKKAVTPSTVLIPTRYKATADAVSSGLAVSEDTSLVEAASIVRAMRSVSSGEGLSATVPISDPNATTHAGSSVLWDEEKAAEFFRTMREGGSFTDVPQGTGN